MRMQRIKSAVAPNVVPQCLGVARFRERNHLGYLHQSPAGGSTKDTRPALANIPTAPVRQPTSRMHRSSEGFHCSPHLRRARTVSLPSEGQKSFPHLPPRPKRASIQAIPTPVPVDHVREHQRPSVRLVNIEGPERLHHPVDQVQARRAHLRLHHPFAAPREARPSGSYLPHWLS